MSAIHTSTIENRSQNFDKHKDATLLPSEKDNIHQIFDKYKATSLPPEGGINCPMCFRLALVESGASCIPRDNVEHRRSHFKRFVVCGKNYVSFDEFKRASEISCVSFDEFKGTADMLEGLIFELSDNAVDDALEREAVTHPSTPVTVSFASPPQVSVQHANKSSQRPANVYVYASGNIRFAMEKAVCSSTDDHLRKIFDNYQVTIYVTSPLPKSGIVSPISLQNALVNAGARCVPRDGDCLNCFYNQFDVLRDNCVTFDAFKRAAEAPDEVQSWLDEGATFKLGAFAPALRVAAGLNESSDFLEKMSSLDDADIDVVVSASTSAIKKLLKSKRDELRRVFQAKQHAEKAEESMNLTVLKMATGSVNDFFGGLTSLVGHPSLHFEDAMQFEHCHDGKKTASFEFCSGNPYKIKTNSCLEWKYVVPDESGAVLPAPEVNLSCSEENHEPFHRTIGNIEELVKRYKTSCNLSRAEVISVILYSGPMFVVYNGILRKFTNDAEVYEHFKKQNNLFPTTIHVLASALQKIARHSRISADTPLFRGLGGSGKFTLQLPDSFNAPDENFLSGYTDYGFQSFTADKGTGLTYSGVYMRKPHACMLEIRPNSIDRAADISEFSQFPMEKEFTFVPCSFVQKDGKKRYESVDLPENEVGFLTVVPARVNANIKIETVEQLESKKKEMHMTAFEVLRVELDDEIEKIKKSKKVEDSKMHELHKTIRNACAEVFDSHKMKGHGEYNNSSKYSALVREMLDTKKMAISKVELIQQDRNFQSETEFEYSEVLEQPLRTAYRTLVSKMLQNLPTNNKSISPQQRISALELCKLKGFIKRDVNDMNELQEKPLATFAADGCSTEDMKLLIMAGANVNSTDRNFQTPLYLAAQYGHVEIVRFLLEDSMPAADPNTFTNIQSEIRSPLHIASFYGHSEIVKKLLEHSANVNARDARRASSLLLAAQQGHVDCVEALIESKANVDLADEDGRTPLFMAAQQNHFECIRSLKMAGADVNRARKDGFLPVDAARAMGNKETVAELQNELDTDDTDDCSEECSDGYDSEVLRSCGSNGSNASEHEKRPNANHESPSVRAAWKPNLHSVHSVRKKKDANEEENDRGFGGNTPTKKQLFPEFADSGITEFLECCKMVYSDITSPLKKTEKMREASITINVYSAVHYLQLCLKDPNQDLVIKVLTEFGDVVGGDCLMRDTFLSHFLKNNANPLLEAMEDMGIDQLPLLRVAAETLSKLWRKPVPEFHLIKPALPTVARLILFEDQELLFSAFSILRRYEDNTDSFLTIVPVEHLVQLMFADENQSLSDDCRLEFVKVLGNIAADQDSACLIHAGILPHLRNMLRYPDPRFRAEACFCLESVVCEEDNRRKVFAYEDIIPRVVELMMVTFVAGAAN